MEEGGANSGCHVWEGLWGAFFWDLHWRRLAGSQLFLKIGICGHRGRVKDSMPGVQSSKATMVRSITWRRVGVYRFLAIVLLDVWCVGFQDSTPVFRSSRQIFLV